MTNPVHEQDSVRNLSTADDSPKNRTAFRVNRAPGDRFHITLEAGIDRARSVGDVLGEGIEIAIVGVGTETDEKRVLLEVVATRALQIRRGEEVARPQDVSASALLTAIEDQIDEFSPIPSDLPALERAICTLENWRASLMGIEQVLFVEIRRGYDQGQGLGGHAEHRRHRLREQEHAEVKRQRALVDGLLKRYKMAAKPLTEQRSVIGLNVYLKHFYNLAKATMPAMAFAELQKKAEFSSQGDKVSALREANLQ